MHAVTPRKISAMTAIVRAIFKGHLRRVSAVIERDSSIRLACRAVMARRGPEHRHLAPRFSLVCMKNQ